MRKRKCPDKSALGTHPDTLNSEKSNSTLLQEIEEMLASPSAEMDTDKIEEYLALLQERAPVMEDYNPDTQWDKLTEQHPAIFTEDITATNDAPPVFKKRKTLDVSISRRRLAFFRRAEVVLAAVLCLVVTANALGINPVEVVLRWADGVVQVYTDPSGVMELPEGTLSEYRSLEAALRDNGITTDGLPTWIPRDYALSEVSVKASDGWVKCTAFYQSERGEMLIRVISYSTYDMGMAEEREEGGTRYSHNGTDYYIVSNLEQSKVGWQVGTNSYVVSGQFSEKEARKIIDSVA